MKKIVAVLLAIIIAASVTTPAFSFPKASEHDTLLSDILFGENNRPIKNKKLFAALCDASAICIDQFGGNDKSKLRKLNEYGIHGIPKKIKKIDISGGVTAQNHRLYTHCGWDQGYSNSLGKEIISKKNLYNKWENRRNVLLDTVNYVFDFKSFSGKWLVFDFGHSEQCESFSAFVYYVHVLGDYVDDGGYETNIRQMIPLAVAHRNEGPDIYSELEKHFDILFVNQKNDRRYISFIQELENQAAEARFFVANAGDIDDEETWSEYKQYVQELIELLEDRVPELLKDEVFFNKVFY